MDAVISKKIDDFFSSFGIHRYKKGELLIRADDPPSGIFYLKEGFVREYAISKKGDELVLNIFQPISFFPMSWAINQEPNRYFFEAMSDVEVRRASREAVVTFIKDNPDVLYDLMSRVYRGTEGLLTRMTYLLSGNASTRLITELLIYAKRFGKGKDTVELLITEKDLAAQSGITRETVSREIKFLKEKKLISLKGHTLVINNIHLLEEEIAEGV